MSCDFDNKFKTRATLGSFSINFLLKQDLKKLGIYGFTWYKNSGYHPTYGNNIIGSHGVSHNIEVNGLRQLILNTDFEIYLNEEVIKSIFNE